MDKQTAKLHATIARRIGWNRRDILTEEDNGVYTVYVGGQEFDLRHGPTFKKLCKGLGLVVTLPKNPSAVVGFRLEVVNWLLSYRRADIRIMRKIAAIPAV